MAWALGNDGCRYLPEDYGENPDLLLPKPLAGQTKAEGVAWKEAFSGKPAMSIGEMQKQIGSEPSDEMKNTVKYIGPASQKQVMKQAATNQELQKAIECGDADMVAAIIRFGEVKRRINVNCPLFPKRERFLHLAAQRNHREICLMLLEARAEIEAEEIIDGRHPLHDACKAGSLDVVELLLDSKAKVEENTFTGMRPLHWAASHGHARVVDFLLDRDAKIRAASSDGLQALHHAARGGHADVVGLLCRRGAKVDSEANGRRPILYAAQQAHIKAVGTLLDHGAVGVLADFGERGLLHKYEDTPLHDFVRAVEKLRLDRDDAEELADCGDDSEAAKAAFCSVVEGLRNLGLPLLAEEARMAGERLCGADLGLGEAHQDQSHLEKQL